MKKTLDGSIIVSPIFSIKQTKSGDWYLRPINICTAPLGRAWIGPYKSERSVSFAIANYTTQELLKRL